MSETCRAQRVNGDDGDGGGGDDGGEINDGLLLFDLMQVFWFNLRRAPAFSENTFTPAGCGVIISAGTDCSCSSEERTVPVTVPAAQV